jgi:hypothetical protein
MVKSLQVFGSKVDSLVTLLESKQAAGCAKPEVTLNDVGDSKQRTSQVSTNRPTSPTAKLPQEISRRKTSRNRRS